MDDVVKVRRSFLNRIRAFINIFASRCSECLHRSRERCDECDGIRAKELISEIDNLRNAGEERYWIDNPIKEREEMVIRAIEQAGKPLASSEIRIDGVSRSLKCFTLKRMCEKKILSSRVRQNGRYEFYILRGCSSLKQTNKQTRNTKNGIQY